MVTKQNVGTQAPDGSMYVTLVDGNTNLAGITSAGYPSNTAATVVTAASGNVAAGVASATLPAAAGKTTYLSGYLVTGGGATLGSLVNGTITGLLGGTHTFNIPVNAGVLLGNTPLFVDYNPPVPASAVNTAVVVSVPSLGAGNTNSAVSAWGYQL